VKIYHDIKSTGEAAVVKFLAHYLAQDTEKVKAEWHKENIQRRKT